MREGLASNYFFIYFHRFAPVDRQRDLFTDFKFKFKFNDLYMLCSILQSPDIFKVYIEELKDARIPYKDNHELMWLILEFSRASSSHFELSKVGNLLDSIFLH